MEQLLNNLTSLLLYSNLAFHVRHFNAKTHAVHAVLQEAYELCDAFADEVGEQYLAMYPGSQVTPSYYPAPGILRSLMGQADIEALEVLILHVVESRELLAHNGASEAIINIIEARMSDLNKVLYRLRLAYGAL